MANPNKLPGRKVLKRIRDQLGSHDRSPLVDVLSQAVAGAPGLEAWRNLGNESPDKYARALTDLTRSAGLPEMTATVHTDMTPVLLVRELVDRFGPDKARSVCIQMGLPSTLIEKADTPFDGNADHPSPHHSSGD